MQVLHAEVPPEELLYVLNGSVVSLCGGGPSARPPLQPWQEGGVLGAFGSYTMYSGMPEGNPVDCLGYGLVRAVDATKGMLYILSDVPLEKVQLP